MTASAQTPASRITLKWFAEAVPGVPLRAALKNNVVAIRWERELGDAIVMTFVVDNAVAKQSLDRRQKELLAAAKAGYLAQTGEHISAVNVEVTA